MLTPAFDKIYPLSAFDYPENHRSFTSGNPKVVELMLGMYMAGHRHRPEAHELLKWVKNPEVLENHQLGALREFVDSWTGFDLWVFHFNSGCTMYEIAKSMKLAGAFAPLPVHHINSEAMGYCGSDDELDDLEYMMHFASLGISPLDGWQGFSFDREAIESLLAELNTFSKEQESCPTD